MKYFIIFFILVIFPSFALAQDIQNTEKKAKNEIILELADEDKNFLHNREIQTGKVIYNNFDDNNKYKNSLYEKLIYQDVNRLRPEKKTFSKTLEKNIGENTSFGTKYNTTASETGLSKSLSLYSRYKKERFAFTSSYNQDKLNLRKNHSSGTMSFSPELILNKHISLKNVYSDNLDNRQKKNELVLSLKPFKDDRMDLNIGAGQPYSTNNRPAKSQLNFSTNFKF